jgi:trehalose 6-phosphate synthase/phosphatase
LDRSLSHIKGLGLSGENGAFIKYPYSKRWINLMQDLDMDWKNGVIELFTYYTERTSGSFIEHKRSSITWNYLLADPVYGTFQAKECQNHLEHAVLSKLPVEIIIGKKKIEVRPRVTNKGEIIKRLLNGSATMEDEDGGMVDFILACGTTEDMFKALKKLNRHNAVSVMVGADEQKKTLASWHLPTVADVMDLLSGMASVASV